MRTRFYTVMVVPHQGRRMKSFVISHRFFMTLSALILVLGVGGMFVPRWWMNARVQGETMEALRAHNAVLSDSLGDVNGQLVSLRDRMEYYEHEAHKLALLAGLEPLPEFMQATGGGVTVDHVLSGDAPPGVRGVLEELEALQVRETRLTSNFEALAVGYDRLEAELEAIPSISPVPSGYFGSRYGWRKDPFSGRRVFHQGQDIVASAGTPILAPASGKVSKAGRLGGLGLSITLDHGKGVSSRYGHMSRVAVKAGQQIERGDVLGYVGSTGRSLGSHLHYEVFKGGKQVDPRDFILREPKPPVG